QGMTEPLPHVERHGVAFCRVIESDDADAVSNALQDFAIGVGFLGALGDVQHRSGFRYREDNSTWIEALVPCLGNGRPLPLPSGELVSNPMTENSIAAGQMRRQRMIAG